MNTKNQKAIVLLSGGLDSATTLAIAKNEGFLCYALTFRYGQRHATEIINAKRVAEAMAVQEHKIVDIDLSIFGGSALTDNKIKVPKDRKDLESDIPVTYVPARNTIFLSYSLAWAEVLGVFDIFIGVNALDYSGYPDCRPEYIQSFQHMANLATAAAVQNHGKYTVHTPIIKMTKSEIIRAGIGLDVDYSLTHSCYDPDKEGRPCGHCDSCQLRLKGFKEAGLKDPIQYQT